MREIVSFVDSTDILLEQGIDIPTAIVVTGKPAFFERAGFDSRRAQRLISPFSIERTLIARRGNDVPVGELIYPLAFEEHKLLSGT